VAAIHHAPRWIAGTLLVLSASLASAAESRCFGDQVVHRPEGYAQSSFWLEVDFWPRPTEPHVSKDGNGACVSVAQGASRLFYFFSRDNLEVVVKVLDGCSINGHFWVFAAGLTDIPWRLRIEQTSNWVHKREWYIKPGVEVIRKDRYEDLPDVHNRWSPDLYRDRNTGRLYHRLETREIPDPRGFEYNHFRDSNYQAAMQVAETKAFRCDR